jgi:hypothetical protein
MRFLLPAAAAAGVLALVGSTGSFAAGTTPAPMQAEAPADTQQLMDMVRDLQIRLDKDEMALQQMEKQLPTRPTNSHLFCGDGYDPGRDACN